jgi:hypothetical protein
MAVTTLDLALAGMQSTRPFAKAVSGTLVAGRPFSYWSIGGNPGAGSYDTTLAGVALSSTSSQVAGQLYHTDPGSGNAYMAGLAASCTQPGTLILCDRLWHNGGFTITSTSAQTVTSAAFPARDNTGTTNGDGVILGMEISAATGAGAPTITVGYTNQANTASRTATNIYATGATSAAGAFYPIGLQAGDTGVRSVQNVTLSATWTSGTMNLVAYRVLAVLPLPNGNTGNNIDPLTGGLPRLYNGVVPFFLFIPSATTSSNIIGTYQETWG